jgi:hypothetical protein
MTVKPKVTGSNLTHDNFAIRTLLNRSCGACGYLGRKPGEGVKVGGIPGSSHTRIDFFHLLQTC